MGAYPPWINGQDLQLALVGSAADLPDALARLDDLDPVAVDVERADWDRYWRQAALIQVGGDGRVVLVDPLTIDDLRALDAFLSERLVVLHAMENDLGPLESIGVTPPRVADTAIAAGLLGLPTGLGVLLEAVLGVSLTADKQAMQRADWEARPLAVDMLAYAAADVAHLPALWTELHTRLGAQERLAWYEEEVAAVRAQPPVEERRRWERLKGVGRLDRTAQGRARALWEGRERLARETDTAPGRILSDRVLLSLAEDPPASSRELPRRGMRRQAAQVFGDRVLAILRAAEPLPARQRDRRVTERDRATTEVLRELRASLARDLGLDPGILCPSRTLMGAVTSDPATPEELRQALGLRDWQWDVLGPAFCEALGLTDAGKDAHREEGGNHG